MSSIRKLEKGERLAHERLNRARVDLIAARHADGPRDTVDASVNERPTIAALSRRVAAYTAQWEAASRRLEEAIVSREAHA